ncbi:MAG TPA: hypothetical protein VF306_02370 [Pirellulales bacterium]
MWYAAVCAALAAVGHAGELYRASGHSGGQAMPKRTSKSGGELFIVDNSDDDWKVLRYLRDWCDLSKAIDVATGYFEIGSLLDARRQLAEEVLKNSHVATR